MQVTAVMYRLPAIQNSFTFIRMWDRASLIVLTSLKGRIEGLNRGFGGQGAIFSIFKKNVF